MSFALRPAMLLAGYLAGCSSSVLRASVRTSRSRVAATPGSPLAGSCSGPVRRGIKEWCLTSGPVKTIHPDVDPTKVHSLILATGSSL